MKYSKCKGYKSFKVLYKCKCVLNYASPNITNLHVVSKTKQMGFWALISNLVPRHKNFLCSNYPKVQTVQIIFINKILSHLEVLGTHVASWIFFIACEPP